MKYRLIGYRQTGNIRLFDFDKVDPGGEAVKVSVSVDTTMAGRYAVGLQELPLLCRQYLEKSATAGESLALALQETDLAAISAARAATRSARRPKSANVRRKQKRTLNHPTGRPI
jgi:hypothetical protein